MSLVTDALPAVWLRDANMGIFSFVRHQVVRILMVTRSSCLLACPCSADEQGNWFQTCSHSQFVARCLFVYSVVLNIFRRVLHACTLWTIFKPVLWLCCRCWCFTLYDVSWHSPAVSVSSTSTSELAHSMLSQNI